ncbi:MAG TPA: DUF5818 domain-containing protein [Candidatus Acidoferrales bacterium]|nr:DUF5818 domain-containing protein [Candidatus Acidoferrales bacterium]
MQAASAAAQRPATADEQTANPDALQTYDGTIISLNGTRYILRDDANNTWYHLDDQKAASKFLGKKVLVTGQLDTRTDVIHVREIEEAKA